MQEFIQAPLHIDPFDVIRTHRRSESSLVICHIPETIIYHRGNLHWYFFSKLKGKVLRRKTQNTNLPKFISYLTYNQQLQQHNTIIQPLSLLISFQQAGTITLNLFGKERTLQFLRGTPNVKNYTLVLLRGLNIEKAVIRAYWTPNYCICDHEQLLGVQNFTSQDQYTPTANTKQHIADVCLSLSLIFQKKLLERIKQMNLLFIKDKNSQIPLLIAVYSIKTQSDKARTKIYNNYKIKTQHSSTQQITIKQQNTQHVSYRTFQDKFRSTKSLKITCFQCSTCRGVFDKSQVKKLTKNRVHSIQIQNKMKVQPTEIVNQLIVDNPIKPHYNRRLFLTNYNQVDVCQTCYERFVTQTEQLKTDQSSKPPSMQRRILRRKNYSEKQKDSLVSENSYLNLGRFKRPTYLKQQLTTRSKLARTRTSATREEDSCSMSQARGRTITTSIYQDL